MKDITILKDEKWVWPAADSNGWIGQNSFLDLHEKIKPYLRGRGTMIQAGGNCGLVLSTFVDLFDTIYTFEPEPLNFYCLNQNVTSASVVKMQACLGEVSGFINVSPLEAHCVDIGGTHVSPKSPDTGKIPILPIDTFNFASCDFIQLDIEGYEYRALLGAVATIKRHKPVICVEVMQEYLMRYDNTPEQLYELLAELGYERKLSHGSDEIYTHM